VNHDGGQFWVYVLINRKAGKRYTGQTDNLERRISEHNGNSNNPNRFTSKFPGK
jgi:predicted GIY-YIG superfamily endonuclease